MKYFFPVLLTLFFTPSIFSQSPTTSIQSKQELENPSEDEKAVLAVIVKVFDGMRAGDSTMVRSCFYKNVDTFTSFTNKEGEAVLAKGDIQKFLDAIGTPHKEVWDEKIWDTEIRIDNNLAQVWTKYGFYLDDKFSHCGVDAFHLTRTKEGWKIFHLTDTRQRKGCETNH